MAVSYFNNVSGIHLIHPQLADEETEVQVVEQFA